MRGIELKTKKLEKKYKHVLGYKELIKHVSEFDERLKAIKEDLKDFDEDLKMFRERDRDF